MQTSSIVSALIIPHGALVLDPQNDQHLIATEDHKPMQAAQQLHDALIKCGQFVNQVNPDIILLLTPHGISLSYSFGIYMNKSAKGTAEWDDQYKEYTADVEIDTDTSQALLNYLMSQSLSVQGIIGFSSSEPAPLRWGEVIPLYFLDTIQSRKLKRKYIIMSIPARRYKNAINMTDELEEIGRQIYEFFQTDQNVVGKKVMVVISGDLAHTHAVSPYLPPSKKAIYPISDTAQVFDNAIKQWIITKDSKKLLQDAASVVNDALSCGYAGFVVLNGLLSKFSSYKGELMSEPLHPTYYGMIVAKFDMNV
jgi:aromatic ring-opening dioxygenase LigB subunit